MIELDWTIGIWSICKQVLWVQGKTESLGTCPAWCKCWHTQQDKDHRPVGQPNFCCYLDLRQRRTQFVLTKANYQINSRLQHLKRIKMIHYDTKQQISSGKRSVGKTTAEAMMPEFWLISQVQVPEITMDVGEGRRKWKKSTLKNSAFSWRIVISPHFESRTPQRTFQVKRITLLRVIPTMTCWVEVVRWGLSLRIWWEEWRIWEHWFQVSLA